MVIVGINKLNLSASTFLMLFADGFYFLGKEVTPI